MVPTFPRASEHFLLGDGGPEDLLPLMATAQLLRKDRQPDQLSRKSFQNATQG